jgi:hypothetical protein
MIAFQTQLYCEGKKPSPAAGLLPQHQLQGCVPSPPGVQQLRGDDGFHPAPPVGWRGELERHYEREALHRDTRSQERKFGALP